MRHFERYLPVRAIKWWGADCAVRAWNKTDCGCDWSENEWATTATWAGTKTLANDNGASWGTWVEISSAVLVGWEAELLIV